MAAPRRAGRHRPGRSALRRGALLIATLVAMAAAGASLDAAGGSGAPGGAASTSRAPLFLASGAPQNWSPFAPSPPTLGALSLPRSAAFSLASMPAVVVNQTGTLRLQMNGTWNPAPGAVPDRDWAALFIVRNGQADFATIEANASLSFAIDLGSVPFWVYFALPSPVAFSGPTSSVVMTATSPGGSVSQLALTAINAGIDLSGARSLPPLPTKSVWFNATGDYTASPPVTGPVNFGLVAPVGGLLPFAVRSGIVQQWKGNATFPGARAFILTPLSAGGSGGPITLDMWTTGTPESGLFVESSLAPVFAHRGENVTLSGTVGNRSLSSSTNWTVNTAPAAAVNHDHENCSSAVRLGNGSWRLFCAFESLGAPNSTFGVDSAFSADGLSWAWEPGVRYELCGGNHSFTQLAIVRTLGGGLLMYYGGDDPYLACAIAPGKHVSLATSSDEGLTWALDTEFFGSFGVSEPEVRGAVVLADGWLRMYLDSASGPVTALSEDGLAFAPEASSNALPARAVYRLTDGSFKLYAGTTSVVSERSVDGLSWGAPQLEVAPWAGDIEAGPLIDNGDGGLRLLMYSQTDGLFVATLDPPASPPTAVAAAGWLSDGTAVVGPAKGTDASGAFSLDVVIPQGAPLGRIALAAQPWFGGLVQRGVVLNHDPVWAGPAGVGAVEDVPLVLDLRNWTVEADAADALTYTATTAFGNLSGSVLTLVYRQGVLAERINGTVTDGFAAAAFTLLVAVTPVNDPPIWTATPPLVGVTEDVPFSVDLSPFVTDEESAASALTFDATSPYATIAGSELHLLYPEGVANDTVTLSVSDGFTAVPLQVRVVVAAVDDPPTLVGSPPAYYGGAGPLIYQFNATDPDDTGGFLFTLVEGPVWLAVSPDGQLVMAPPAGLHGRYNYAVRVNDTAGLSSPARAFVVVLPDNRLPVMAPDFSDLPANALLSRPFVVFFNVTDPDVNDTVLVTAAWDDPTQTVTLVHLGGTAWRFEWVPTYTGPRPTPFAAWLNGTLSLNDSFGVARYPFSIRVLEPPSRPPLILGTVGTIRGLPNETVVVDLNPFMTDPDEFDPPSVLEWTFEGDVSAVAEYLYDNQSHHITFVFRAVGNATLVFRLWDPGRLEASEVVTIQGIAPPSQAPSGFPWWAVVLSAGALVGIAVFLRGRAPAPPPAAAAPVVRRPFLVEDVFLLYRDGRTLFTRAALGADQAADPEVMGAMLVAVQDFMRDSMKRGERVDRMGYGENIIMLTQAEHTELAVTVYGEPDAEYRDLMSDTLANVEAHFAGVIEKWSGNRADFEGVEGLLQPLWQATAGLTRADVALAASKREVQVLSGIDFFQGYVRLKVSVVNNTGSVVSGVTLDIDYNADVLRLQRIDPPTHKASGSKVHLGVLPAAEKAALTYYFDPQVCTISVIDGSCRFKDAHGHQQLVPMKSRKAEIVCPLFFTKEQANTAMLKRLVETEAREFDVRAYSFGRGATTAQLRNLFTNLKAAVLAHEVQLVRSYEGHHPYGAEAWFYGATQGKGYPVIVRAVVEQARHRAEFFVASVSIRAITGLLAELHHTLLRTRADQLSGLDFAPLLDEGARAAYADWDAVSKMLEGEAPPGETDAPQEKGEGPPP